MESPLTTRAALLLALRDGPGYGLDLIRRVAERSAGSIRLSAARVYPALAKLEDEELVQASTVVPKGRRGARARTYYDLTVTGVAESRRYRDAVVALAAGQRAPAPSGAERARMAQRLLVADELSSAGAELSVEAVRRRRRKG